jgi:hypothetical protein
MISRTWDFMILPPLWFFGQTGQFRPPTKLQYEIDGEIVTAEQVKGQAYKYKPGDPEKAEGEQEALSAEAVKQKKEPKDGREDTAKK